MIGLRNLRPISLQTNTALEIDLIKYQISRER